MFTFLNVFDGKPDHPMSDAKQAKNLLVDLPKQDAFKALNEITAWLISVKDTVDFRPETRVEIIMLLDETGLLFYEQLLLLFTGEPHLQDFKGKHIWQGIYGYKKAVAEAYALCIEEYQLAEKMPLNFKQVIPIISVRLLRALSEKMQLSMMRYVEVGQSIWNELCSCYVTAVAAQVAEKMVIAYPKQSLQITPDREFLRAMMLYISSPATLAPDQIAACYRIVGHLVSFFDFKTVPDSDCTHFIDLAKPSAPKRVDGKIKVVSSIRFFGAAKAAPKLANIIEHHEQALVQQEHRALNEFTPSGKLTVIKHLQLYWGKNQPSRNQERLSVAATVEVIHGIRAISQMVTRIDQGSLVNLPVQVAIAPKTPPLTKLSIDEVNYTPETWIVLDVSENGVGGVIPKAAGVWVKVGDLCALKMESGQIWWVGMIRRVKIGSDGLIQVGIEILAKKPLAVLLCAIKYRTEKGFQWNTSVDSIKPQDQPVILLPDINNSYANATMLMESGTYVFGAVYELMMGASNCRNIKLTGLLEEGGDYERVSFSLMA
jgi:hypothetical protein